MNKLQWNLNQSTQFVIQENASENNVCEMADILSRGGEGLTLQVHISVHDK